MKIKIRNILIALLGVLFVFTACKKEEPVKLDAQMNTWKVRNITSTSAELSGMIVAEYNEDSKINGDCPIMVDFKEYGVCWSTAENPTVSNSKASMATHPKAVYWLTANNLEHLTTYYARAYAVHKNGNVFYGEQTNFTTLANVPYISVAPASNVAGKSASITGNLTADGKAKVSEKGICWSKKENPTVEDTVIKADNVDLGAYTIPIENLEGNTTYYVRAYAINKIGTAYSKQIMFTTDVASPTLTTDSVENVDKTSLDVYGTVIVNGGADVTERGFCWATTENPEVTATNKVVFSTAGIGSYKATIENLDPGTIYYIRAYAINSKGTAYGSNIEVKTVTDIQKLYVPGGYQKASGYGEKDWNPAEAPFIINTKDNKVLEGYVYFASGTEFKLTSDPDWDHTNYGDGGSGKLDPAGGNISVSEGGYYKITADLVAMTYTATKVDWRLIGDAVGGWDNDKIDMVYNKSLKRLVATGVFADGGFKMRGNADWGINLGQKNVDNGTIILDYGTPDNIGVTAGTYTFIADLSTREYKGVLTQWGVIGDAVGGWDNDIDMTADPANNTWTYTGAFTKGGFKFRANDAWGINLGGDVSNLSFGGGNIEIPADGNYTVVLDLVNNKCTVTSAK